MYRHSPQHHFHECQIKLLEVRNGILDYLDENKNVSEIDPYGDVVCSYILRRESSSTACKIPIRKQVSKVCDDFKITIVDAKASKIEVSGHAKIDINCGIMVTEKSGVLQEYEDCTPEIPKPVH